MTQEELVSRFANLARLQYGPQIDRVLVTAVEQFRASLGTLPPPADTVGALLHAGDLIRLSLLRLAEHLKGGFEDWAVYHQAAADLPDSARRVWLPAQYLGLDATQYERLTGVSGREYEECLADAKLRVRETLGSPRSSSARDIDEEWLKRTLQGIHFAVWKPHFGDIPRALIAIVRDALKLRMIESSNLRSASCCEFYLAFGRLFRDCRKGNLEGMLNPLSSPKLNRGARAEARKAFEWLQRSEKARKALMPKDVFGETCFALAKDAYLDREAIAQLVRRTSQDVLTPKDIDEAILRYDEAIRRWISDHHENGAGEGG